MDFIVDKQTLDDLNILGEFKQNSLFSIFCDTNTYGGKKLMEIMFLKPLTNPCEINSRSAIIEFFGRSDVQFPFERHWFQRIEDYISSSNSSSRFGALVEGYKTKTLHIITQEQEWEVIETGVRDCAKFLREFKRYVLDLKSRDGSEVYSEHLASIFSVLDKPQIRRIIEREVNKKMGFNTVIKYDYTLRTEYHDLMNLLLQQVYYADIYATASRVARERGYHRAICQKNDGKSFLQVENVRHPAIRNGVGNSLKIDEQKNVMFLTGANMAGKSTLMKSVAISVYAAQMGFPVAAEQMQFTTMDGIYTSINVADNMNKGYSHYMAEVLRVKSVAERVAEGRNLFIIFDELFKGTNVKDAFDATVATTVAFGENTNCLYIISTHILEAGEQLRKSQGNFNFVFLPTTLVNSIPRYTYKLEQGISADRHGMMIIRNERIIEIIDGEGVLAPSK